MEDRQRVAAARTGDRDARAGCAACTVEERPRRPRSSRSTVSSRCSALAADRVGRTVDVVRRYPFLVGDDPQSLDGVDDSTTPPADGALLVATTDPIHHGHAYGTPPAQCLDPDDPATLAAARSGDRRPVDRADPDHRFADFAQLTEQHRSDFRDTARSLAHLVGRGFEPAVHDLSLVDYAEVLDAPGPSWVAGALVTIDIGS